MFFELGKWANSSAFKPREAVCESHVHKLYFTFGLSLCRPAEAAAFESNECYLYFVGRLSGFDKNEERLGFLEPWPVLCGRLIVVNDPKTQHINTIKTARLAKLNETNGHFIFFLLLFRIGS